MKKLKQLTGRESGFTIIEVLIVLAIAGLILAVVFLAVPNLQRGQRNNARKQEASRVSTAVLDFGSNNGSAGSLPKSAAGSTDCASIKNLYGTLGQYGGLTCTPSGNIAAWPNAGFTNGDFYIYTMTATPPAPAPTGVAALRVLVLAENATCNGPDNVSLQVNKAALLYSLEGTGNNGWACLNVQ